MNIPIDNYVLILVDTSQMTRGQWQDLQSHEGVIATESLRDLTETPVFGSEVPDRLQEAFRKNEQKKFDHTKIDWDVLREKATIALSERYGERYLRVSPLITKEMAEKRIETLKDDAWELVNILGYETVEEYIAEN